MLFGHFSKRTLALILILLLVTGGLLYLAIVTEQKPQSSIPTPTPKVSLAHTTLSLAQATPSAGLNSIDILIDTSSNNVTGAQFEIAYDSSILTNVRVLQGNFLSPGVELLNNIDTKNGRISYAVAISPTGKAFKGKGTLAHITYTLLPTTEKTTKLSFLPKSQVTQEGTLESVLLRTLGLTLTLPKNPTTVPLATGSAQ